MAFTCSLNLQCRHGMDNDKNDYVYVENEENSDGGDGGDGDDDDDDDLCAVFCPAGQEKDGDQNLCRPCEIGFYRTGENPYSNCMLCPNNTRTMTTGSTTDDDCAICKSSTGVSV